MLFLFSAFSLKVYLGFYFSHFNFFKIFNFFFLFIDFRNIQISKNAWNLNRKFKILRNPMFKKKLKNNRSLKKYYLLKNNFALKKCSCFQKVQILKKCFVKEKVFISKKSQTLGKKCVLKKPELRKHVHVFRKCLWILKKSSKLWGENWVFKKLFKLLESIVSTLLNNENKKMLEQTAATNISL